LELERKEKQRREVVPKINLSLNIEHRVVNQTKKYGR
jgi:hypothetical protein